MSFNDRWRQLTAAARQMPEAPLPALNVERILSARRSLAEAAAPAQRTLRIGWFPPGLAAAAVLACVLGCAAGLDPRPAARDAGLFLADLPRQVPRSPALLAAPTLPSAAAVMGDLVHQSSTLFPGFSESSP